MNFFSNLNSWKYGVILYDVIYKYAVLFVNTWCLIDSGIVGGCSDLCGELHGQVH